MSRQFFKNAALLAATEVVVKLKPLIAIPLLTRHFGALNYGVWSQMSVMVTLMPLIILLGTDGAIIRYMPGTSVDAQKRFFSAWMVSLSVFTICVCIGIVLFKGEISLLCWGETGEYEKFIPILAAAILAGIELSALKTWFRVHNDAKTISAFTILQATLGLVTILIILIKNEAVYQLVIYNIFADFLGIVWLVLKITRKWGWSMPDFSSISVYLRFGLPVIPHGLAVWGLNYMDRFFLVKYSTMAEIGIYSVSYSIGFAIIQIFVQPVWAMYPNTASGLYNQEKHAELQRLFERSVSLILVTAVPSIIILYITGERILAIFTTREFIKGGPVIAVIAAGYLFHILGLYYEISLWLINKQFWSSFSVVMACVVNYFANILLIPRYSIIGAAIATAVAFCAQMIISLSLAACFTNIKTNFIFLAKIVVISIIMGLAIRGVSMIVANSGLVSLLMIVMSGVVCSGILFWIFNVVDFKKAIYNLRRHILADKCL